MEKSLFFHSALVVLRYSLSGLILLSTALPPLHAQGDYLPTVKTPITPVSASLGVYGEIPVSKYTGIPDISIPLYNIDLGGFQVPISLMGGFDNFYTHYNFIGDPLSIRHEHSSRQIPLLTEWYSYWYDHAGRIAQVWYQLSKSSTRIISSNGYDELGRLDHKTLDADRDIIHYGYNLRGWMTDIQSNHFRQKSYYTSWINGLQTHSSYSGNPSGFTYSTKYKDPKTRALVETPETNLGCSYNEDVLQQMDSYKPDNLNETDLQLQERGGSNPSGIITRYFKGNLEDIIYQTSSTYAIDDVTVGGADNLSALPVQFVRHSGRSPCAYDANGNLNQDLDRNITGIDYNLLNLPNRISFRGGSDIRYTYDANGKKLRADYTTVKNEVLAPVGGNPDSGTSGSLTIRNRTDYCGNFIYEDGALKKILIEGGYVNYDSGMGKSEFCYYIKDHLGNNRVVLSENRGVVQYADYFSYGIPFSEIPMQEDDYLYAGKELERMHGLYWYDNGKRWYDPIYCRFTTMDPLCEKYYDKNPYAYCGDNPMKYADVNGDSLTFLGNVTDIQSSVNIANSAVGGFYTTSVNEAGLVSLTATDKQGNMTPEQKAFYRVFSNIVDGANGMTSVNVVSGDQNVLIGDITTATIDIGDIGVIGSGDYVNKTSTFAHEIDEQYRVQVLKSNPLPAHIGATHTESLITGSVYNPMRPITGPINGAGTVMAPIRDPSTGQWRNIIIHYQNGNVTGIIR